MNIEIDKYLSSTGLKFPKNENELQAFDKVNSEYDYVLKEDNIDPYKILKDLKSENKTKDITVTNVDYHKRTVLAAEIVFQLKGDYSLGHLKLQKLMFLCQNTINMAIHTNFLRQAMGPYDPKLMRSIDSQFKKREWFEFKKEGYPKYVPLAKNGEHKEWYQKYFSDQQSDIETLIETFRNLKTNDVELVATLFACWKKALENRSIISNQLLIQGVYEWHETKKDKFTESQINQTINWMNEKGIYPVNK